MRVKIITLHCLRCDHRWVPTLSDIRMCPKCKSVHWNTLRKNRQGLRSKEEPLWVLTQQGKDYTLAYRKILKIKL